MDVGFIGIGSMGAAMVPNLVGAGHRIAVWNRNVAATKALDGVEVLTSPIAAFQNDAVITMLSDDTAVRNVFVDSGALSSARKDCIHVMMSTISLALIEELEELHRSARIAYVAAPVFGVLAVAAKARLDILAAGGPQAVATVQPLLDALGQRTWRLGDDPKHANVAKLAGNMMITLASCRRPVSRKAYRLRNGALLYCRHGRGRQTGCRSISWRHATPIQYLGRIHVRFRRCVRSMDARFTRSP